MSTLRFTKMHGIGNDFVMVNAIAQPREDWSDVSRLVCDRHRGVGSDGLILLLEKGNNLQMRMFNPDGSESEMCGNGVRCFALFARDQGVTDSNSIPVETGAGLLHLTVTPEGLVKVDMGPARISAEEIGMAWNGNHFLNESLEMEEGWTGTAVSMGNPHLVLFSNDVQAVDLEKVGPVLENHRFFPKRVNVHFVEVIDRTHIIQRTWERGAGITLACGTGACACGVASFLNGKTERSVEATLPGGKLHIEYHESGRVLMTGPAETVFEGEFKLS